MIGCVFPVRLVNALESFKQLSVAWESANLPLAIVRYGRLYCPSVNNAIKLRPLCLTQPANHHPSTSQPHHHASTVSDTTHTTPLTLQLLDHETLSREPLSSIGEHIRAEQPPRSAANHAFRQGREPVSYTHLTLPTKRIV